MYVEEMNARWIDIWNDLATEMNYAKKVRERSCLLIQSRFRAVSSIERIVLVEGLSLL